MSSIKENVTKAVKEFNKYRTPEAEAELLSLEEECFKTSLPDLSDRLVGFMIILMTLESSLSRSGQNQTLQKLKISNKERLNSALLIRRNEEIRR